MKPNSFAFRVLHQQMRYAAAHYVHVEAVAKLCDATEQERQDMLEKRLAADQFTWTRRRKEPPRKG